MLSNTSPGLSCQAPSCWAEDPRARAQRAWLLGKQKASQASAVVPLAAPLPARTLEAWLLASLKDTMCLYPCNKRPSRGSSSGVLQKGTLFANKTLGRESGNEVNEQFFRSELHWGISRSQEWKRRCSCGNTSLILFASHGGNGKAGARVRTQPNISPPPPTSLSIQAAVGH